MREKKSKIVEVHSLRLNASLKEIEVNIIPKLSPLEIKIIPHLKEPIEKIVSKSGLDKVSVLRALTFLENKNLVKITTKSKKDNRAWNKWSLLQEEWPA